MTDFFSRRGVALKRTLALASLLLCAFFFMTLVAPAAQAQVVSLDRTAVVVPEGNAGSTKITFQIRLSTSSSVAITVPYGTTDNKAKSGEDYIGGSGTVTFAKGELLKTVEIDVLGDTTYEDDEDFKFTLGQPTSGSPSSSASSATIVIKNDDAQPTLSIADASPIAEGNPGDPSPVTLFRVSLSQASGKDVVVQYRSVDVSATSTGEEADYTPVNSVPTSTTYPALVFAPGTTELSVQVKITPDSRDEATEYFKVQLYDPVGANLVRTEALGTITDDDGPSAYFLGDASISETEAVATVFVALSASSPETITLNFRTNDNVAISGKDYEFTSGQIVFSPGETTKAISVKLAPNNNVQDGNRHFTVDLSGASGGVTILDSQAIINIIDDEGQPVLSISSYTGVEGNGNPDNVATFKVTLSPTSLQTITVSYRSQVDTSLAEADRAYPDQDFEAVTGSLTFAPGENSKSISLRIIGDTLIEKDERFQLALYSNVGALLSGSGAATATIIDDDVPTLSVAPVAPSIVEGNSGTKAASFQISLSAPSPKAITVSYLTVDGTATAADGDYEAVNGLVTFAASTDLTKIPTPKTVTVNIKGDTKAELDETFQLQLSSPINAAVSTTAGSATQTIKNDDTSRPYLRVSDISAVEGSDGATKAFNFQFNLIDRTTLKPTTLGYAVPIALATADGTATAPSDYTAFSGTLSIPAGSSSLSVPISVVSDKLSEENEVFVLNYAADPTLVDVESKTSVKATITDDDQGTVPVISVPAGPLIYNELDYTFKVDADLTKLVPVTIPVTLSRTSGKVITVNVKATNGEPGAVVDSAVADSDYIFKGPDSLTFNPGITTQNVTVYINGDKIKENTERFYLDISGAKNANLGNTRTTIRIMDNDEGTTLSGFTPEKGYAAYSSFDATTVTLTGTNFSDGTATSVPSVYFTQYGDSGIPTLKATIISSGTTTATVGVPAGSLTGPVRVVGYAGSAVSTKSFIVQPTISTFTPTRGVAGATTIKLEGVNLASNANPVTGIVFPGAGGATVIQTAFSIAAAGKGQGSITCPVPVGAISGRLALQTKLGAIGPNSAASFTVDTESPTFTVTPSTISVREGEGGSFQVKLNARPSANVVVTFSSSNTSKVRLLSGSTQVDSLPLTFTTANYSVLQTVSFNSLIDNDGNSDVVIIKSVVTTDDTNYKDSVSPQAQVTVTETATFEPGVSYSISFPYMPGSASTEVGTPTQIFSRPLITNGVYNYRLFAFAAKKQDGSLLPIGSETGTFPFVGYTEIQQGQELSRGRGYILINGANTLSLKAPAAGTFASTAVTYTFNLARNTAGVTGGNSRNGLNFIGFPFDPGTYQYVDLKEATVVANGFTYDSIDKAAAAGVMSADLYEGLPSGKLSKVSSSQRYLRPFKGYFVQIYQDNVTLILKNPVKVPLN